MAQAVVTSGWPFVISFKWKTSIPHTSIVSLKNLITSYSFVSGTPNLLGHKRNTYIQIAIDTMAQYSGVHYVCVYFVLTGFPHQRSWLSSVAYQSLVDPLVQLYPPLNLSL